jgi:hypothetical protein
VQAELSEHKEILMKLAGKTRASVISCNTPYQNSIDALTLVGILAGRLSPHPWQFHLNTFFNELPKDYILGVMEENNLTMQNLTTVFYSLHTALQGKNFKEILGEER